jgi:SET domain-containing protein 6
VLALSFSSLSQTQNIEPEEVEDAFVIEWGSEDPDSAGHLTSGISFHGLPDDLAEQVKAFLKVLRKANDAAAEKLADSDARKEVYLGAVLKALDDRIAQYGTSLDHDIQIRDQEKPTGTAAMALAVRIGEKTLLAEARKWVEGQLMANGSHSDGLPASKRQKTAD